ncbi:MAG: hypothetical protein LIR50_04295 [Bacillota bacterium]|nr:hypothetical protein [Bacillota bacterium]
MTREEIIKELIKHYEDCNKMLDSIKRNPKYTTLSRSLTTNGLIKANYLKGRISGYYEALNLLDDEWANKYYKEEK